MYMIGLPVFQIEVNPPGPGTNCPPCAQGYRYWGLLFICIMSTIDVYIDIHNHNKYFYSSRWVVLSHNFFCME